MKSIRKVIERFLASQKGATDMSDRIINIVVAAVILFSLFGTAYAQFVLANASANITATHSTLLGVVMTLLIVGFVIMIWKASKGR